MPNPSLIEWVAKQHEGQLIRRTNEPYLDHLLRVAEMSGRHVPLGFECGLCHDLFEKTKVTPQVLNYYLSQSGHPADQAATIVQVSVELTDIFTKVSFPELTKTQRKQKEEQRLIIISPTAQTVKYADLYDNAHWMLQYEPRKAPEYLQRKKELVTKMNSGDPALRKFVLNFITAKLL